jgi:hypothetical protein
MDSQIERVINNVYLIESLCLKLVSEIPSFEIASEKALPYGLKPHTRSVSWLVEQVLVQSLKQNASKLGISNVDYDLPDTALHDLSITSGSQKLLINIKTHQVENRQNKNDISAVEKLFNAYKSDSNYELYYVAFGIKFSKRSIIFPESSVHCFSPQFLPIYVNPRNDKIQAFYHHDPTFRSRKEFLKELSERSTSISL